jgi:hypothetical protein
MYFPEICDSDMYFPEIFDGVIVRIILWLWWLILWEDKRKDIR